jgi:hypothetical protein
MYIGKNRRKSLIVTLGNSNSSDRRHQESEPNLRSWGGECLAHRNSNRYNTKYRNNVARLYIGRNTSERLRVPVTHSYWLNRSSCQWLVQQADIKIVTLRSHSNFVQVVISVAARWIGRKRHMFGSGKRERSLLL